MRLHISVYLAFIAVVLSNSTNKQTPPNERKPLIINEIKLSQGNGGPFIEIKSEVENISLDGYYVTVMGYSRDHHQRASVNSASEDLRVHGILNLRGKRLRGRIGYVGK